MRHKASEDMSEDEYRQLEIDIKTKNPHPRCACRIWDNEDGLCSYCDWEENNAEEELS